MSATDRFNEVRSALFAIPSRSRDVWVKMAMSLKSELGEPGLDLWMEWSRTDASFVERDALAVWKSIKVGPVTARSMFAVARANGWLPQHDHNERRPATVMPVQEKSASPLLDWSERAESIFRKTRSLTSTIGEIYLQHRECALPPPDSHLRFLPSTDQYPPSLCALVTDAHSAEKMTLHFTRLAVDGRGKAGSDRDKLLLAGHRKRGGVIRLWPDEAVNSGLAIAEGIESALAAAHAFKPVWAAIDAGNLAVLPVLAGIEALTIVADHDDAGIRAAKQCAQRWADSHREVRIAKPRTVFADAADVAVRAA